MQLTPSQAFEHVKESVVEYLETAYRISDPLIFEERGEILRQTGTVAQSPFIEATPAFPPAHKLVELEHMYPHIVPSGLADLVQHGVPVDRFALYTHQEQALLNAFGNRPNLLVATGTGSGKTESFLLPILADILHEARKWAPTADNPQRGHYDVQRNVWLHSRRHESRPAALRGIILYPMNALVNDQLSRLRRILARGTSPDWQKHHLAGNVIHFGMYTGLALPTGHWSEKRRRTRYEEYYEKLEIDWKRLRQDLRETGNWPRPDSPEMLCRWDIQLAPPDILVTNYSMLEYMLVRPIENPIFERTRQWLERDTNARITLVLDEAHTYTGAKGTEVAHLVRRLKERLGIEAGSSKFRAIATTASVPSGANSQLLDFTSDLFGEPADSFSLIGVKPSAYKLPERNPSQKSLQAFAKFHNTFNIQNPMPAIEQLSSDMNLGMLDRTIEPLVSLYSLLEQNKDIHWTRQRTARRATLLTSLADEYWSGIGTSEEREHAMAGILAAGSFARPSVSPDTPPLLSMRVHAFFRGIPGIWACMNPECTAILKRFMKQGQTRSVGRLYVDPRPWCDCGARVLELFSCRHCGLLFLGGIPDSVQGGLWPWSDDLSGERQDVQQFRIFGVERPHSKVRPEYRSIRTTLHIHQNDIYARAVYEIEPAEVDGKQISPFPTQCPRCQNYRAPGQNGREVIEPLRTKGPRSFSIVAEDGFRVQPRMTHGEPPNYGRKSLLFTDSRLEAAQLAADLRSDHHNDLFRQLVYRVLHSCLNCSGTGYVETQSAYIIGQPQTVIRQSCPECIGTGRSRNPLPMQFEEIRSQVMALQLKLSINPTNGKLPDFFAKMQSGVSSVMNDAKLAFNIGLRREISEDEFALEPLGLASWRVILPEKTGAFAPLNEEETKLFLRSIARLLATENILLPPKPHQPWEWPEELVKEHERYVIIPGYKKQGGAVPYNLKPKRKLGRYVIAVSEALVTFNRLKNSAAANKWVEDLHWPLWNALKGFNILEWAGAKINEHVPQGIRIDSFELYPISETVQQCQSCSYVMSETLFGVCIRCGQHTEAILASTLRNFYRRAALYALPNNSFDDPYPLRSIEHTAQISSSDARNEERWFQDLFHDDQQPEDHRIDILSVTTTMEMGIDIGSLLSVGLRNVPPTVANYQQRAGRAGRRGSSVATVFTFAQFRSHDQYYFDRPPEIVSNPPRVPALYLQNEVIAQRHMRSLVFQSFFFQLYRGRLQRGLFGAWGTVSDFTSQQASDRLRKYIANNRAPLIIRCSRIVHENFEDKLDAWLDMLITEIQDVVDRSEDGDDLLVQLINTGLLPKYAFPVDVVSLSIPSYNHYVQEYEFSDTDAMQRDLKIALSEYAPGGEITRGEFPNTYIYRSAGVYDPFEKQPNYQPTGILVECFDCQSISLVNEEQQIPDQCEECNSWNLTPIPYLRPHGFTVDAALRDAGRKIYEGGGRERAGMTQPAKLLVGQTSFSTGKQQIPFASHLYTRVRSGELFSCNKGPNVDFPGFHICPECGRALDEEELGAHKYPASIPPHNGKNRGPRAGQTCQNTSEFNQVILGYKFFSEVILFGVDLPMSMDAPFREPSGKAAWYSFGTLIMNAASLVLQIDPGELQVGVRAVKREYNRVHAEVFLYDDVPGGAGYAHSIERNLEEILRKALDLGKVCRNPDCSGACYHCMYDYRNQMLHPLLDRTLGASLLDYILHGTLPSLDIKRVEQSIISFSQFAQGSWEIESGINLKGANFSCILRDRTGQQIGLQIIHPLQSRPSAEEKRAMYAQSGIRCAVHTSFDLDKRPFWVLNNLVIS